MVLDIDFQGGGEGRGLWQGDPEQRGRFGGPRSVEPVQPVEGRPGLGRRPLHGGALPVTPSDPIVDRVARSRVSVLIGGETGAGKEVLARRLHDRSPRARRPWVAVNAAAVCSSLLESELFGYERGAFTGAVQSKPGLIETADAGTLFLDEVADLPLPAQAKLLRVIETRMVTRVGGVTPRPLDVRFLAATNRDLHVAVAEGTFREDLLFRLEGIALYVSPIRDRPSEIAPAAAQFLAEQAVRDSLPLPVLSAAAERALLEYAWPGNFRELRNVVERAALVCNDGRIDPGDLLLPGPSDPCEADGSLPAEVRRHERERIVAALAACAGNQTRAARTLGISRRTLISRLQTLGIARPRSSLQAVPAKAS